MIGEIIGEILIQFFVHVIFAKIIKPFFFYHGVAFQLFLNLFRKTKIDAYKKDNNTIVGLLVLFFGAIIIMLIVNF